MELLNLESYKSTFNADYIKDVLSQERLLPEQFKVEFSQTFPKFIFQDYTCVFEGANSQNLRIYFPNQWFYIAAYLTNYYQMLVAYKEKVISLLPREVLPSLKGNEAAAIQAFNKINYNGTDRNYLIKFCSDYSWWNGAKTIDRGDFFVSPILSLAKVIVDSDSFISQLCQILADSPDLNKYLKDAIANNFVSLHIKLLAPDDLAKRVRESFIRYWNIIDEHGTTFELYVSKFEQAINPAIANLGLPYNSVFEIVNNNEYKAIIAEIIKKDPSFAYLDKKEGPNGDRYYVWSTHRKYSNYLDILAISDFQANIKEQKMNRVKSPLDEPLQVIYYGAPGTGKSHTIDDLTDDENSVRTTFHPDSDYASFVGAYKPTMKKERLYFVAGTKAVFIDEGTGVNEHPGTKDEIVYKYVPQAFLKAYVAAWKNYLTGTPYFLIIEEINRGNCAQIFGDLFQLLDRNDHGPSSYPIDADDDIRQFIESGDGGFTSLSDEERQAIRDFVLVKDNGIRREIGEQILNGSKLLLPPNLYIWATMNTSDQSLFPIDSAFKRRWNWRYQPIDTHVKQWTFSVGSDKYLWGDFLDVVNPVIKEVTESADKQMGYFFAKADPRTIPADNPERGNIVEEVFLNKVLFYIWTDVFKDYAVTDSRFIDEATGRLFDFPSFFRDHAKLEEFISQLKLQKVLPEAAGQDQTRYLINGQGRADRTAFPPSQVFKAAVEKYVVEHPEQDAEQVIAYWQPLVERFGEMIIDDEQHAAYAETGEGRRNDNFKAVPVNGGTVWASWANWTKRQDGSHPVQQLADELRANGSGIDITIA